MLKREDLRFRPWTTYPLLSKSSASSAPSWPVIPVTKALGDFSLREVVAMLEGIIVGLVRHQLDSDSPD